MKGKGINKGGMKKMPYGGLKSHTFGGPDRCPKAVRLEGIVES